LFIKTGIKNKLTAVDAILPNINAIPSPPKIGSVASSAEPSMMAMVVKSIGFALVAVAFAMACSFGSPFAILDFEKSMSNKELLALIPIREIKPIKDVAVKKKFVPFNSSVT